MIYHSSGSGGNIKNGACVLLGFVITASPGGAVDIEIYDDTAAATNKKFQIDAPDGYSQVVMLPDGERFDNGISVVFGGTGFWSVIYR